MNKLYTFTLILFTIITSCKKSDTKATYKIDSDNLSLHYNETHQFQVKQGNTEIQASTVTWTSSDQTVGTINTSGLFAAKKIGTVTITGSGTNFNLKSTTTVSPYKNLGKEPFYEAGATIEATKAKESRILSTEDTSGLAYYGENSTLLGALYLFKANKMTSAALLFKATSTVNMDVINFYSERYKFITTDKGVSFFTDTKGTIIGFTYSTNLGYNAIYFTDTSGTVYTASKIKELNTLHVNALKNLMR